MRHHAVEDILNKDRPHLAGSAKKPWLERFSSVEEVQRVLRDGGMEAALLCPIAETRNRLTLLLESLTTPPSTAPLPSN